MDELDTTSVPFDALVDGIDRGIEAHMSWNQRLVRCALLRESPGDDVLLPNAHELCRFGIWFASVRDRLENFDATLAQRIAHAHQSMHNAVRALCGRALQGLTAEAADLQAYEREQSTMLLLLNTLRQHIVDASTHLDVLTGLPLRHGLEYAFDLRCKDARRTGAQNWLALIDADHFKLINDAHGHIVGDTVLKHIAHQLSGCMRETDSLIRFGGDEFLALLPVTDPPGIKILAQRLLDALRFAPLHTDTGLTLALSVTVGLARVRTDEELPSAIQRADHALLQGKERGRNCFTLVPD